MGARTYFCGLWAIISNTIENKDLYITESNTIIDLLNVTTLQSPYFSSTMPTIKVQKIVPSLDI
jgi:hypothetical protein